MATKEPTAASGWLIVLALSLGPAVSNGFARFGYALILPSMQTDLAWNYATAGWINTANAAGYLVGAILVLRLARSVAAGRMFRYGMVLTALSLWLSGFTNDIFILIIYRILAGIGGATAFIAGGAMAASAFQSDKSRNALAIAVYYGGAGLGILLTAVTLPPLLAHWGAPAWPYAWWVLGLFSFAGLAPAWWAARGHLNPPGTDSRASSLLKISVVAPSLVGYFLFASGYIIYMTFVIAWMKDNGATLYPVVLTWSILGLAVMFSSVVWRRVIEAHRNGVPLALSSFVTGLGAFLPLIYPSWSGLLLSAAIFGVSFFIAPTAVTAFSKKNLPRDAWGSAVALYTTVFAAGQTIGPIGAGWLSDMTGDLSSGLTLGAVLLAVGSVFALFQKPLSRT